MSRGPRRLLDDPDFKWETGCDLADEGSVVGDYDLTAAKDAVMERVAAAAAANASALVGDGIPSVRTGLGSTLNGLAVVLAGVVILGGAFWLGRYSNDPNLVERSEPQTDVRPLPSPLQDPGLSEVVGPVFDEGTADADDAEAMDAPLIPDPSSNDQTTPGIGLHQGSATSPTARKLNPSPSGTANPSGEPTRTGRGGRRARR